MKGEKNTWEIFKIGETTQLRQGCTAYGAFTLVELIVVITILAILGTIAFISLQGYSMDARNTKRTQDLSSLKTKLELGISKGINLYSFVDGTGSTITGGNIHIAGYDDYDSLSGSYVAGDINYSVFGIKGDDFKDPSYNIPYKIGVTGKAGGKYELAASVEEGGGQYRAFVNGTRDARNSADNRGARDRIDGTKFYLSGSVVAETGLVMGDRVGVSTGVYIIIRTNNNFIEVDRDIDTPGANIFLKTDETRHLIKKWDSNYSIDETGDYKDAPYY